MYFFVVVLLPKSLYEELHIVANIMTKNIMLWTEATDQLEQII